jgi:hypothetical protein
MFVKKIFFSFQSCVLSLEYSSKKFTKQILESFSTSLWEKSWKNCIGPNEYILD